MALAWQGSRPGRFERPTPGLRRHRGEPGQIAQRWWGFAPSLLATVPIRPAFAGDSGDCGHRRPLGVVAPRPTDAPRQARLGAGEGRLSRPSIRLGMVTGMHSPIRRHLTYANITATLALVFAMSGGALAAKHYLITSTGQISPKVLKNLRHKAGPRGPTGAAGPAGKEGPSGKSVSAAASGSGSSTAFNANSGENWLWWPATAGQVQTVASLSLPAGKFAVFGKLVADNDGKAVIVRCELSLGETIIDKGFDGVEVAEVPNDRHTMVLAGTGSLSGPGTAKITCSVPVTVEGKYMDRSITAIQVGNLG
jgi:hypothetical protein